MNPKILNVKTLSNLCIHNFVIFVIFTSTFFNSVNDIDTVCLGRSDPFYIVQLLYKMCHFFLDTQYLNNFSSYLQMLKKSIISTISDEIFIFLELRENKNK